MPVVRTRVGMRVRSSVKALQSSRFLGSLLFVVVGWSLLEACVLEAHGGHRMTAHARTFRSVSFLWGLRGDGAALEGRVRVGV